MIGNIPPIWRRHRQCTLSTNPQSYHNLIPVSILSRISCFSQAGAEFLSETADLSLRQGLWGSWSSRHMDRLIVTENTPSGFQSTCLTLWQVWCLFPFPFCWDADPSSCDCLCRVKFELSHSRTWRSTSIHPWRKERCTRSRTPASKKSTRNTQNFVENAK